MSPQIACPVCRAHRCGILYSVDSEQATQHYVLLQVDPARHAALKAHIESLWRQSTCDILRCDNCGFCFAHPFVAGDSRFYELAYQRTGYPAWKWEYERTLQTLTALSRQRALEDFSLLEIGAGDGAFVKRVAPELTAKRRVLCTEFSDFGRRAIEAYGVECRSEDVRMLSGEAYRNRFDVVCMFQVLEHMDRLDDVFAHLGTLTTDGAHLFIAVPNENRIAFNEQHGSLLDLPPNHVGRWSRQSFRVLAQRHGWRELDHQIEPEPPARKVKQFVAYRYRRRSQNRNSLANRIERLTAGTIRKPLRAGIAALYAAGSLPDLYALLTAPRLGDSQWVHLQRTA